MKQTILGALMGALVVGAIAACGVAISDPGNNQNANTNGGNVVCNCKEPTVYYKEITVTCKDGDKVEQIGEKQGTFGLIKDIKPENILAAIRIVRTEGIDQRHHTPIYAKDGKAYVDCALETENVLLTLKR